MENQEYHESIKKLVVILRRVTFTVQILPFVYSLFYIVSLILYNNVNEEIQLTLDSLFYISPVCIIAFLVLSKALHLCGWHRTACIIPAIPLVVNFIDYYIINFSEAFASVFGYMIAGMCILLLFAAYNVFIK